MDTATGIRIDLPLLDYSRRRETVLKECYLVLYKDYMIYKVVADYEELDRDTEVWGPVKANHRYTRKRSTLHGVDMYYANREQMWSVDIDFLGVSDSTAWLFDDPKKALAVYTQLCDYMVETGRQDIPDL